MPTGRPSLASAAIAASLAVIACRHDDPARRNARESETRRKFAELTRRLAEKEALRQKPAAPAASSRAPGPAGDAAPPAGAAPAAASAAPTAAQGAHRTSPWIVDEPIEVGPASPASATSLGVVANTLEGDIAVARLSAIPRGPLPAKAPLRAVPPELGPFTFGRGPSLFQDFVYWISHGSLVRRRLTASGAIGPLELLAKDAFDGTRVAAPIPAGAGKLAKIPATVAYIVRPPKEGEPLVAKLWVEGAPPEVLTSEGNSTHSVSLVHTADGVLVVSVQARMAMTPVHARRVRFADGRPLLGDDLVVWVGGGIQPLTEMTLLPHGDLGLSGFLPHERSMNDFGIAKLDIGMNPSMDTRTTWMLYPNGIDPAPVAAGHLCGEPVVLYSEPEARPPGSPQELLLRSLDDPSGARSQRIAGARGFYFVSLAEVPGGALAVWVTGGKTMACTVRCTRRPK
jgi:hypothetical protein